MRWLAPFTALWLLAACSSENGAADAALPDAGGGSDGLLFEGKRPGELRLYADLPPLPDLAQKLPCENEWRDAIHAQTAVSTGAVSTTEVAGGIKQTTLDATAGGMNLAPQNPFVYLSLEKGGVRADLDDFAAHKSQEWDLAFKRAVILLNGGDSGPGQGAVAILPGKTLEQVTAAPPAASFASDDFLDASCKLKTNAIGDPSTAFGGSSGEWYDYQVGVGLQPKAQVYVVRSAKGKLFRLVIEAYYKGSVAAEYTLRWSTLP